MAIFHFNEDTYFGLKVLTAVDMTTYLFRDVTPCGPMEINRCLLAPCFAYSSTMKVEVILFLRNVG
jgi:hypothetical protein